MTTTIPGETFVVIDNTDCYAEAYLWEDGRIGLHIEDGDTAAEPVYTIEQARKLHETLGHLLYLANQD